MAEIDFALNTRSELILENTPQKNSHTPPISLCLLSLTWLSRGVKRAHRAVPLFFCANRASCRALLGSFT